MRTYILKFTDVAFRCKLVQSIKEPN